MSKLLVLLHLSLQLLLLQLLELLLLPLHDSSLLLLMLLLLLLLLNLLKLLLLRRRGIEVSCARSWGINKLSGCGSGCHSREIPSPHNVL